MSNQPTTTSIQGAYDRLQQAFRSGITKSYDFRIQQLRNLRRFLVEEELSLGKALAIDLHRGEFEAIGLEITAAVTELDFMIANLRGWMRPTYTAVPALFMPATSEIIYEPYGVTLVIGAFNYPLLLTLSPLIGAIAAGNCAMIKPSEMATASEKVLADLLPKYLDQNCYQVVCGDYKVSASLLDLRWDKIFFTGSTRVGKIVLKAAAEHLTPVSLELGGKSPTIVDKSARSLELAVQRVLWGKCVNAGQTCIAPDYLYVHEDIYEGFLKLLKQKLNAFYGNNPQESKDLARIITPAHYNRLANHVEANRQHIFCGGGLDEKDRYIEPTVFTDLPHDSSLMSEELFGPLLPVFKYRDIKEVINYVGAHEKPLTMYIFSTDQKLIDRLIGDISSGSVVVNDVLYNFANIHAPFGGVGHSGMGGYRGKFSFETFSHRRSVLRRDDHLILDIPLRYPPYSNLGLQAFKLGSKLPNIPPYLFSRAVVLAAGLAVVYFAIQNFL